MAERSFFRGAIVVNYFFTGFFTDRYARIITVTENGITGFGVIIISKTTARTGRLFIDIYVSLRHVIAIFIHNKANAGRGWRHIQQYPTGQESDEGFFQHDLTPLRVLTDKEQQILCVTGLT